MPPFTESQRLEANSLLEGFMARSDGHPSDRKVLGQFLSHRMAMNSSEHEVKESIPNQIQRVRQLFRAEEAVRKSSGGLIQLNLMHQLLILLANDASMSTLIRFGRTQEDAPLGRRLERFLAHVELLVARYMQRNENVSKDLEPINDTTQPRDPSYAPGKKQMARRNSEKKLALQRDNFRCLLTNGVKPEACHIIPFSYNSSEANKMVNERILIPILEYFLPPEDVATIDELLFDESELRSSDYSWNILSFCSTVHDYWSRCYFVLKWIEVAPLESSKTTQTVALEFQWLPRTVAAAMRNVLAAGANSKNKPDKPDAFKTLSLYQTSPEQLSEMLTNCFSHSSLDSTTHKTLSLPSDPTPMIHHCGTGLPIKSGCRIYVEVAPVDVPKMKLMIELQYILTRLAGLSGAADVARYLDPRPPPPVDENVDARGNHYDWERLPPFERPEFSDGEEGEEELKKS